MTRNWGNYFEHLQWMNSLFIANFPGRFPFIGEPTKYCTGMSEKLLTSFLFKRPLHEMRNA